MALIDDDEVASVTRLDNVLARAGGFRTLGPWPIDERLPDLEGSDRGLFARLKAARAGMSWPDSAIVEEAVPPRRRTAGGAVPR